MVWLPLIAGILIGGLIASNPTKQILQKQVLERIEQRRGRGGNGVGGGGDSTGSNATASYDSARVISPRSSDNGPTSERVDDDSDNHQNNSINIINNHPNSRENKLYRLEAIHNSLQEAKQGGGSISSIHSNYIQNARILKKLSNHRLWRQCDFLSQQQEEDGGIGWLDKDATPTNIWEELAVEIWKNHPLVRSNNTSNFAGYEYWCNILTPGQPLGWHVDKDEVSWNKLDTLVNPIMGAVYYGYPHQFTGGGYLEVLPFDPYEVYSADEYYSTANTTATAANGVAVDNNDNREWERIEAKYNRMVILNVSKWHRVTPLTSGSRYTLAVNIWKEKPLSFVGVPTTPTTASTETQPNTLGVEQQQQQQETIVKTVGGVEGGLEEEQSCRLTAEAGESLCNHSIG